MNIIKAKDQKSPKITDLNIYTSRMEKGIEDKLFFLPYLNDIKQPILFIDFGCADGMLLKQLLQSYPNLMTVGIDNSKHMYALVQKNLADYLDRFIFYTSLEEFAADLIDYIDYTIVLNCSSVLHEVHHYSTNKELDSFYQVLKVLPFDYIFIRDMYCRDTTRLHTKFHDYETLISQINNDKSHKYFQTQLKQFESEHGDIVFQKNFLHFLMKYKYIENWERECPENYFAEIRWDDIERDYECIYKEEYQLPYLTKLWKDEFNIELEENTHIKCIYKRKLNK